MSKEIQIGLTLPEKDLADLDGTRRYLQITRKAAIRQAVADWVKKKRRELLDAHPMRD